MSGLLAFIRTFEGSNARFLLDAYPDYPVYATVLYLAAVFYLPGYLEKRNLRFKLKWTVALWNLFLSVVSFIGSFYTVQLMYDFLFVSRDFFTSACEMIETPEADQLTSYTRRIHSRQWSEEKPMYGSYGKFRSDAALLKKLWDAYYVGPYAFFVAAFMYLKTPELLDTIFLILQGKPVSFLHWFHHIVTAIYCWQGAYVLCPTGIFFVTMNYSVHSVMYFYYFLVTLGYRKSIRPFAPVITLLQVTQMFIGMFITAYTYFQYWLGPAKHDTLFYAVWKALFTTLDVIKQQGSSLFYNKTLLALNQLRPYVMEEHFVGCDTDTTNLRMGVMMFACYCVLFCVLFKELYLDKRANEKSIVLARKKRDAERRASHSDCAIKASGAPLTLSTSAAGTASDSSNDAVAMGANGSVQCPSGGSEKKSSHSSSTISKKG